MNNIIILQTIVSKSMTAVGQSSCWKLPNGYILCFM